METFLQRVLRGVAALALAAAAASAQDPPAKSALPTAAEINGVLRDLSDITGFRIHRQLPFEMVNRQQINRYLQDQIRTTVKPAEIRAEEVTLKKFGFVPADFDLKKTTIDLLTEQAAAFYDFRRKKLYISDWAAENMRDEALVHELGHALADQNFPIQKFLAGAKDDSEGAVARQAIVEGQASWLVLEYAARKNGKTLADPATAELLIRSPPETADTEYPVFGNAPLYLRVTMLFPYDQGQRFQQALFLKDGRNAFSRAFGKPPATTAQIIHPERYFAGEAVVNPKLQPSVRGMKTIAEGTVGELDQQVILRQSGGKELADALAPKFKGGSYRIEEPKRGGPKRGGNVTLLYVSEWAGEEAASQYFAAWQRADRAKWKHVEVTTQDAGRFQGKSEEGYFRVTLEGTRVTAQEGFEQPFLAGQF